MLKRKSSLIFGCFMWWALWGDPSRASAQLQIPQTKIFSIAVSNAGPQTVSESIVRANIRVKEGETYNRNAIDDDILSLYRTGYFSNVRVAHDPRPDGVALLYIVQGRMKLTDILFTGNKRFSNSKLSKKVTSKVGQPLDDKKLFTDAQEIKKLYEK